MGAFDAFGKALKDAIKEASSREAMRELGEEAVKIIKTRTRSGYGVAENDGEKQRLKPLSDSYIEQRKRDKKKGKLASETSPTKSNLTRTGQMLDSIGITKAADTEVLVGPSGTRRDGKSNAEVAEYVAEGGRPFDHFSRTENAQLLRIFERRLREAMNKRLR